MTAYQIAIETIGKTGSLAILKDETVVSAQQLPSDRRTAATLAVHLDELLTECRHSEISLRWVSVAAGPGSFTGLRIGVTAAKMLAYALSLPVLPVGSLAALANAVGEFSPTSDPLGETLAVAMNAYRGQVYAATFTTEELSSQNAGQWEDRAEVLGMEQWERRLQDIAANGPLKLIGDVKVVPTDQSQWFQKRSEVDAVGVGRLACKLMLQSDHSERLFQSPFEVVPRYLRPSAAEEKASSS
ncbi:MAG: tRNA (adenosine(37)-N6)-threonylcarbamoyltransferase complex dimerization subunit type 1 TsaB [Planctomycetota bacterium]